MTMFMDTNYWLSKYEQCLVAKGDYTEPKTLQGSLVAHQPLELLCMDFTKADISKGGKENILVLTDVFSKYSQAFITSNHKSLTVAKLLVEKWFSIFGIPTRIHSDQGKSFDNEIISHLCKMYGIMKSTTTPFNPHGNLQCKCFNRTLFSFMHSLDQEQKPNWPIYLPSLVYAYNASPHSTTGFQLYELMFGCKAPMPCDNWLGLRHYEADSLKSKTTWLSQQLNSLVSANKQVLKLLCKTTQCNKACVGGTPLLILVGNHVLLQDHPKGRNKIQDRYKSDVYVIVGHHHELNIYYIHLLNKDHEGHPKVVSHHQIYGLNHSSPPLESLGSDSKDGDTSVVPSFLHHNHNGSNITTFVDPIVPHHYNTRSKLKATAAGRQVVVKTQVTHL